MQINFIFKYCSTLVTATSGKNLVNGLRQVNYSSNKKIVASFALNTSIK